SDGLVPPAPQRDAEPRGRRRRGSRRDPGVAAPRAALLAELLEEPEALPLPRGPPAPVERRGPPAGLGGAAPSADLGPGRRSRAEPDQGEPEPPGAAAALSRARRPPD